MPATVWAVNRSPPDFVPGQRLEPGFDDIPMLSTLHQRFTCVRLLDTHLTASLVRLFPDRSLPGLLTQAASGRFGTWSCNPIPKGLPSSPVQQGCFKLASTSRPPFRAVVAHSRSRSVPRGGAAKRTYPARMWLRCSGTGRRSPTREWSWLLASRF